MEALILLVMTLAIGTSAKQPDNDLFCVREAADGIEQKVRGSEIVIAGYTRSVYAIEAEFLVFSVIKGEEQLSSLFKNRKLSALETALNRKLVNVTSFVGKSSQSECQKRIRVGETYLVFAKLNRILVLDGDDGIQVYSKTKEEEIRKLLAKDSGGGSSKQWSDWDSCSKSCGGGIQTRRPDCGSIACPSTEGSDQQRSCNTFACVGLLDVLEVVGLRQTRLHPADRSTAYRLVSKGSWSSAAAMANGFPEQFSLLMAIRALSSPPSGFLLRMLLNDRDMQLALHISADTVSLILPDHSYARFKQEKKLVDNVWYWMSFSVRSSKATFFLNCKPSGVETVSSSGRSDGLVSDKQVKYVVGSLGNRDRSVFQGDVEQILFAEAPSAAAEQCSVVVEEQPVMAASSSGPAAPGLSRTSGNTRTYGLKNTKTSQDDDFAFSGDGSTDEVYDDEYEDEAQEDNPPPDIRKAVLLLSESPAKDDDEESENSHDLLHNVELGEEEDEEYEDDDDEEEDQEDDEEMGSGSSSNIAEWSDWSECSQTCDRGVRTRSMVCMSNRSNKKDYCYSNEKQSEACFLSTCSPPTTTTTTAKPTTQKKPESDWHTPVTFSRNSVANRISLRAQPKVWQKTLDNRTPKVTIVEKHSVHCKLRCQNRGYCSHLGNCICKKGFSGKLCERATCEGLCENGGTCAKHGRCICFPGYYDFFCEFRKCNFIAVKRPYEKSYKKMRIKEEKYPCGAWGWKKCTTTKVYYEPEFKTFYRTEYVCDSGNDVIARN